MTIEKSSRSNALFYALHFGFFLTGIVTVLIGQVLPVLSKRLSLEDAAAGNFFIAQFLGSLSGVFIFSLMLKRFGFVGTILVGLISMGIGCLLLNASLFALCLLGFYGIGIGIGTTLPAVNMFIAELRPTNRAVALNVLNFCWGIGAIVCAPFFAYFSLETSLLVPTIILASTMFLMALTIFAVAPKDENEQVANSSEQMSDVPIWSTSAAWLIAAFQFLHVGIESAVGGWLTTYSARIAGEITLFSPTLMFFSLFVVGRGAAPLFLRLMHENTFILFSLILLVGGIFLLISADTQFDLIIGASVLGFGTAPIFPTNMARFTQIFGESATRRSTPLFIASSLGSMLTTSFIGYISTYFNNLRSGIYVILVTGLILIVLQISIAAKTNKMR
jgi:fucose permease